MNRIVEETYYTLKECFQIILEELALPDKTHAYDIESFYTWFGKNGRLFSLSGDCLDDESYALLNSAKIEKLYKSFYTRYMNQYILCLENEELKDSNLQVLTSKMLELANYFNLVVEKYAETYYHLSSAYSKLLDKVENVNKGVTQTTDAPQDVKADILENSPEYVTAMGVTAESSTTDYEPLMNRLKTIQENMRNIVKDFTDEMGKIFYEHLNI